MMFGNPQGIAIEVDNTTTAGDGTRYLQLRFIIAHHSFGNWEEPISLTACAANMEEFLANSDFRLKTSAKDQTPDQLFASTFDAFYDYDYSSQPVLRPNLRDRHHLNEIGLGAIRDQYGIVVVEVEPGISRIIVKDLRSDRIVLDHSVETDEIAMMGTQFIDWAKEQSMT